MREACDYPGNFRSELKLEDYLKNNKIMALEGIDTRALTKLLRNNGTMRGVITIENPSLEEVEKKINSFDNSKAVMEVTTAKSYTVQGSGKHVALMDFGSKENIIRSFKKRNCKITVVPAGTKAEEILNLDPDLVFLSNGPGNPEDLEEVVHNIKTFVGKKPIGGICLGHQLIALALGGSTSKLKFGHRGCNHPVKALREDKVYITSQNHGYYVDKLPEGMEVTHVSMNDGTLEGMRHKKLPIYTVQFHPEACPGPGDISSIFDEFLELGGR